MRSSHETKFGLIWASNICPPIPVRDFDWHAVTDDYDGAPDSRHQFIGYGKTEQDAVKDLLEQLEDA